MEEEFLESILKNQMHNNSYDISQICAVVCGANFEGNGLHPRFNGIFLTEKARFSEEYNVALQELARITGGYELIPLSEMLETGMLESYLDDFQPPVLKELDNGYFAAVFLPN